MLVRRYLLMLLVFLVLFFSTIVPIHVSWVSNADQRLSAGEVGAKIGTSVLVEAASPGTPAPLTPPAIPL